MTLVLTCVLAGCGPDNPVLAPVGWWHDLQGGEIAATRPPPPGADQPYPHVFSVPERPTPPSAAFRQTVQTELTQDRDTTERLAANTPIELPAVPPPPRPPAAPADPPTEAASASLPGADAPARAATKVEAESRADTDAPTRLPGIPADEAGLPAVPAAPPPPPAFVQSASEAAAPAPAPPVAPAVGGGARVLFATGDATLLPSQLGTVRDVAYHRGKNAIVVEGHGDAEADTEGAQQRAVQLGLRRAAAIARVLTDIHVPADKIRLGATAFGRDATMRVE